MPTLDTSVLTLLVLVALALLGLLVLAVVVLGLRLRKLRRDHRRAFRGVEDDVLTALGRHAQQLDDLRVEVGDARAGTLQVRELVRGTVQRVAILRYDAFDDMGGALSFSAALLDEHGDGIVLSAINGRTETRAYAKPIAGGRSDHSLSVEEEEVVDAAIEGRAALHPADSGRRRRRAS